MFCCNRACEAQHEAYSWAIAEIGSDVRSNKLGGCCARTARDSASYPATCGDRSPASSGVRPQHRALRAGILLAVVAALAVSLHGAREVPNIAKSHPLLIDRWIDEIRLDVGLHWNWTRFACRASAQLTYVAWLAVVLAALRRNRRDALVLLMLTLATLVLSDLVLKPLVDRRHIDLAGQLTSGSVFPSGHAAVLGCIWLFRERSGIDRRQRGRRGETVVIAGVVLLVSLGMIYSACHFATDVIAGLCLGIAVGDIVALAVQLNRGGRCAAPE